VLLSNCANIVLIMVPIDFCSRKLCIKFHNPEPLPADVEKELDGVTRKMMKKHGISNLPLGPS